MIMLKASTSEESGIPVMRCRISPIPVVPPATRSAGRRKTLAEKALRSKWEIHNMNIDIRKTYIVTDTVSLKKIRIC